MLGKGRLDLADVQVTHSVMSGIHLAIQYSIHALNSHTVYYVCLDGSGLPLRLWLVMLTGCGMCAMQCGHAASQPLLAHARGELWYSCAMCQLQGTVSCCLCSAWHPMLLTLLQSEDTHPCGAYNV